MRTRTRACACVRVPVGARPRARARERFARGGGPPKGLGHALERASWSERSPWQGMLAHRDAGPSAARRLPAADPGWARQPNRLAQCPDDSSELPAAGADAKGRPAGACQRTSSMTHHAVHQAYTLQRVPRCTHKSMSSRFRGPPLRDRMRSRYVPHVRSSNSPPLGSNSRTCFGCTPLLVPAPQ